ncbi:hypothetical protein [Microvirga sp. VF16]|uniref:hypothetical protein n=1 Tax=Microvirga sp. VF16 TaxID=2807101 RepID=UPI0035300D8E
MTHDWISRLSLIALALLALQHSVVAQPTSNLPAWLETHVGEGDGQIAAVVLQRARALYLRKVSEGRVRNPCYFAMDATRPANLSNGRLGRRFYIICEAERYFRAVASGHGSGRILKGLADFSNGRQCAKNFGNAQDSLLTAGGAYVTAETKTSFKGYYRTSTGKDAVLMRSFVQFDGEGETASARVRAIGGHAAHVLRATCRRKRPDSPYAGNDGYVPVGKLVDYAAGRSNGCTSWSVSDAEQIVPMMNRPATLYIYPESADIDAVGRVAGAGRSLSHAGLYWNASCLKQIGAPKFWSAVSLEPIIARYEKARPAPAPQPLPICEEP